MKRLNPLKIALELVISYVLDTYVFNEDKNN